jgi:lysyl-tRNA synthetase class 2
VAAIRCYFQNQNFVEVETPTFVPCPGLDAHVDALAKVQRGARSDFLITSPEFHMKRLLAAGMPRIVQFARCFRRDEEGPLHEPEFTLIEWYRAFAGFEEVVHDTEELVVRALEAAIPECSQSREFERPFLRCTVREAFMRSGLNEDPVTLSATNSTRYFQHLVETVEPWLASLKRPVFLTEYPASQAALARAKPGFPDVAERFELYIDGVELSNGYGELTDGRIQRGRFELELDRRRTAGEDLYPLDERFLGALYEGLPPCSGNALGLDRLVALATGAPTIQCVLPFSDQER